MLWICSSHTFCHFWFLWPLCSTSVQVYLSLKSTTAGLLPQYTPTQKSIREKLKWLQQIRDHTRKALCEENQDLLCLFLCHLFVASFQNNFSSNARTNIDTAELNFPLWILLWWGLGSFWDALVHTEIHVFVFLRKSSWCACARWSNAHAYKQQLVWNKTIPWEIIKHLYIHEHKLFLHM